MFAQELVKFGLLLGLMFGAGAVYFLLDRFGFE